MNERKTIFFAFSGLQKNCNGKNYAIQVLAELQLTWEKDGKHF
jgi:hypothetical protein